MHTWLCLSHTPVVLQEMKYVYVWVSVCSITHNLYLDSESRFTGLGSCYWMTILKQIVPSTWWLATFCFIVYLIMMRKDILVWPPMDVSTVLGVGGSSGRCQTMQTGETLTHMTPSGVIEQKISIQIWILGNQMNNPKLD